MIEYETAALTENNLRDVTDFLVPVESSCVSLMSMFVKNGCLCLPANSGLFTLVYKVGITRSLCAVILCDLNGFIFYHIAPAEISGLCEPTCDVDSGEVERFASCIKSTLAHRRFDCLVGDEEGFNALKSLLPQRVKEQRRLILCEHSGIFGAVDGSVSETAPDSLAPGLFMRRCSVEDTELLLPLQEAYEIEEVIPAGAAYSRSVCEGGLRFLLRTQRIYAIFDGGIPIAKAATNAIGFGWDQVGGVYTHPSRRNRGLARFLTRYLAKEIQRAGKKAVLFVRTENKAALASYRRAGYVEKGSFCICYF